MPRLDGIDVARHQGEIDWDAVADERPDLRFVMARMSHGGHGDDDLRVDPTGAANQTGMRRAFPRCARGYYHFLGSSSPKRQARHFREQVGELDAREFVMVDVEVDEPARVGVLPIDHIVRCLEAIEEAMEVTPWLYIPQPKVYPESSHPTLHRYPLMLPIYGDKRKFDRFAETMGRPVMVWQWGGDAEGVTVAGIGDGRQRVDSNRIMDDSAFEASLVAGGRAMPTFTGFAALGGGAGLGALGFLPELRFGDRGNAVVALQALLIEHGVFRDLDRNRDGAFEDGTEAGVQRFQRARALPPTGRVDPATWAALAVRA